MTFVNRMTRAVERCLLEAGRSRARAALLAQSDRLLADSGFSRELLERGNGAWPWRVADTTQSGARVASVAAAEDATRARAVAELKAMSDAELADLGLSRAGIVDAVRHGRPGVERAAASGERIAA